MTLSVTLRGLGPPGSSPRSTVRRWLMGCTLALLAWCLLGEAGARRAFDAAPGETIATVAFDTLPRDAQHTLALIRQGGPFAFPRKDGSVFANRERQLPRQPRGYYHEYTVASSQAHTRGARRIIAGSGAAGDVSRSDEYYYTDDHYASFRRVVGLPRP